MRNSEPLDELTLQELRSVLDEAISGLPEKYRTPIVLCYLEGNSHDEAARELGWPKRSLTSRLAGARELLREHLTGRGIALTAGAMATALAEKTADAALGAFLTINTARAASAFASGKALSGGIISATAITLAEEAMKGMLGIKAKLVLMALTLGLAVGSAGLAGEYVLNDRPAPSFTVADNSQSQPPPAKAAKPKPLAAAVDAFGDPLPEGVVGRLGTTRFRAGSITKALAFTPNGKILAALGYHGNFEGGLWLWDAATGQALHHASISPWNVSMAFSPDGKVLFTGQAELKTWTLRLIEVPSGKVLGHLEKPDKGLDSILSLHVVAFSPDGRIVAAAGWDASNGEGRIVFWDVASGKVNKVISSKMDDTAWTAAFSPDGKILATGGDSKSICYWDVETGKALHYLEASDDGRIDFLAFAATGKVMASIGQDWTIRLWDVGARKLLHRIKGNRATMMKMALSPDGAVLASGGRNGTIHIWDAGSGKKIREWQAHPTDISSMVFSPDGTILASTGQTDCSVRRWETATGKEIDPITGPTGQANVLRFALGGMTLMSCGRDAKVMDWDLTNSRRLNRVSGNSMGPTEGGWHASAVDLSPDGKVVALAGQWWTDELPSDDVALRFCDVATGKEIRSWKLPENSNPYRLEFSPDGKLLATVGRDGIRLNEIASAKEIAHVRGRENAYEAVAFSPDSKHLAVTQSDAKSILLWDIAAKKELRRWTSEQTHVGFLLFAPDGKSLVSAPAFSLENLDRPEARVWDVDTGKQLASFNGLAKDSDREQWRTNSLAISANGRVLAVGVCQETRNGGSRNYTCKIHLCETISGQKIREIDAAQGTVYSLAFAPDGRMLAAGGADSTILLWDLTGQPKAAAAKPSPLSSKDLSSHWPDLANDAAKADRAIWTLAFAPKQAAPFLKERLLVKPADAQQLAKHIADLDSNTFATRQKAVKSLEEFGETAESALRQRLKENPPLEVRQRVEQILEKRTPDVIRNLRAIEAVEQMGTPEARQLLETLSKESPNPRVAEAAAAAVKRMVNRGS